MIRQEWVCESADINTIGQELGYDWNHICDLMSKHGICGMDGSGSWSISRRSKYQFDPIINHIFRHIFETHPEMDSLTIIDDF